MTHLALPTCETNEIRKFVNFVLNIPCMFIVIAAIQNNEITVIYILTFFKIKIHRSVG